MRVKYMDEQPGDQDEGTLLDEYVRAAMDLHERKMCERHHKQIGEYAVDLRDEIVRRMRKVF